MQMKYAVQARVIFHSKYSQTIRNGKEAKVVAHGERHPDSGVAHAIEFEDGHQIWAYPQELSPTPPDESKK